MNRSESPNESDFVRRIAAGDAAAIRLLVDENVRPLTALARRMLGSQEEAEEVVQEVFLKAWTNAARWEAGRAQFSTWLHRVAVNLCLDRLRRRREVTMDELPETADPGIGAERELIAQDVSRRVDAELQALPERQRLALVLCHYQGHSQNEAAEILEITVEALESLLARARRRLKERLADLAAEHLKS